MSGPESWKKAWIQDPAFILIETGTCLLSPEIPRLGGVSVNTKSTDTSQSKSLSAAFNKALSQLPSKVINWFRS
jgi:hypothetical protein